MKKSNLVRQKEKIEKLKRTGKYKEYLQRNKMAKQKNRLKQKQLFEQNPELKKAQNEKIRLTRKQAKKKEQHSAETTLIQENTLGPYPNSQVLGKHLKILKNALPKHSKRAIFLLETALNELKAPLRMPRFSQSNAFKDYVVPFFRLEDISYASPERRHVRKILVDGIMKDVPLRFMKYTYREAFVIFKNMYPDVQCAFTSFFESKPEEIVDSSKISERVCVCDIHANMRMSILPLLKSQLIVISEPFDPLSYLICPEASANCYENNCQICKDDRFLSKIVNRENLQCLISWQKWNIDKKSNFQKMNKTTVEADGSTLYDWIASQRKKYTNHVFIKRSQASYLTESIEECKSGSNMAVIQMDYAENYLCRFQDAPQQANYGYNQVFVNFFLNECIYYFLHLMLILH